MKSVAKSIITLICIVSALPAYGGWASGGGKFLRDSNNPWFLENTTEVRYCVSSAPEFGVDAAKLKATTRWAFKMWQSALRLAVDDGYYAKGELQPYGQIRIGTQKFTMVDCDQANIDVRFQYGILTQDQLDLFENPKDYVGIAIRTDYDRNLKGKGFVYLAPPAGSLAPEIGQMHPDAWKLHNNLALKSILLHEVGHIFGRHHETDTFMDERWPEYLVNKKLLEGIDSKTIRYFENKLDVKRLLGVNKSWHAEGCNGRNPVLMPSLFGEKWNQFACGKVTLIGSELKIYFQSNDNGIPTEMRLVGKAHFNGSGRQSTPSTSVWLPQDQELFTVIPEEGLRFRTLVGMEQVTHRTWGSSLEIISTGEKLPLLLEATQQGSSSNVIKNGLFETDIFFLD